MTTEMTTATAGGMTALQVCDKMASIESLGKIYAQSGFFGAVTPSVATAALINAFTEGLTPANYKAKYHTFTDGQTGVRSDYIQREFHRLGGKWKFLEWSPEVCSMEFAYGGETMPFAVTFDEFKANGVAIGKNGQVKDNWRKFPREMLKARCMATAIRAMCPEVLGGMYTVEEIRDFDSAPIRAEGSVSPSPTATETATPEVIEPPTDDANICPCGSVRGKAWSEIETDMLIKILNTPLAKAKTLTAKHREAISLELLKRNDNETDNNEGDKQ